MAQPERAECQRCQHHYVTYEPTRPHGCRHFGFVSWRLPSLEVASASGQPCGAFEARPPPRTARGGGSPPRPGAARPPDGR